jgi:hypothetical protein
MAETQAETPGNPDHCMCDAHECLRILQRVNTMLTRFEPVLNTLTNGGRGVTLASMRRTGRGAVEP